MEENYFINVAVARNFKRGEIILMIKIAAYKTRSRLFNIK